VVGLEFYLQAFQLKNGVDCHKNMMCCVVTVRVGDFANPALDFNDL
jgi:hypothetical protein